jgi:PAS domain-containing protein
VSADKRADTCPVGADLEDCGSVARSDTLAGLVDMSTVAVFLESVTLAGGLALGVWSRRSRNAALRRVAALEARLEEQRSAGERREGLLRTVVETTPVAMVLFGDAGDITFTNRSARDLFFEGMSVEGQNFLSMIERHRCVGPSSRTGTSSSASTERPDARRFTCRGATSRTARR